MDVLQALDAFAVIFNHIALRLDLLIHPGERNSHRQVGAEDGAGKNSHKFKPGLIVHVRSLPAEFDNALILGHVIVRRSLCLHE